nr:MAG TPA: hypothetical protein [Caudoviricetes sp.]
MVLTSNIFSAILYCVPREINYGNQQTNLAIISQSKLKTP